MNKITQKDVDKAWEAQEEAWKVREDRAGWVKASVKDWEKAQEAWRLAWRLKKKFKEQEKSK